VLRTETDSGHNSASEALPAFIPEPLIEPLTYLLSIWNQGALNATYGSIILAVLVLLFSLMIRGLFARLIVRRISKLAEGTQTSLDDALVEALATPLKLVPVILGVYFALETLDIQGSAADIADRVVQSVITMAVFWTLSRAVNAFEFLFSGLRSALSPAAVDWMVKLLEGLLIVFGLLSVASIWDIPVAPILASLGVFGIAVGLGAQDLF